MIEYIARRVARRVHSSLRVPPAAVTENHVTQEIKVALCEKLTELKSGRVSPGPPSETYPGQSNPGQAYPGQAYPGQAVEEKAGELQADDITRAWCSRRSETLVSEALQRIESDTYGTCVNCERPISPKRLAATPWARYCIACQEIIDRARPAMGQGAVTI